jgi:hypothetical protein
MKKIITGYRIGRQTEISRLWNAGKLTRDDIRDLLEVYEVKETEEECCNRLHDEVEERVACRLEEDETIDEDRLEESIKKELEEELESELESELPMLHAQEEVVERLQEVYDDWTDDAEDCEHFDRVYHAHDAISGYHRGLYTGCWPFRL